MSQVGTANNTNANITGLGNLTGLALGNGSGAFTGVSYTARTNWTPILRFGGATTGITYTIQSGLYQRIGNMVFWQIWLLLSSKGSATGAATLAGFPVAALQDTEEDFVFELGSLSAGNSQVFLQLPGSATTANLLQINTSGVVANLTDTNFTNTTQIKFSSFYFV